MKIGVVLAGMLALSMIPSSPQAQAALPRLVANSHVEEPAIRIPLRDPQYPATVTDQASTLFADVNAERVKRGLPALTRDETLDRFAAAKGVEMAANGYFGHTDPNGVSFQDRLRAWHWPTTYAAENIAFDYDEPRAHAAFMGSPPHAQNLLDAKEKKIGVAVITVGNNETFYVEDFSAQ